jgi:hypothetical protein
VKAFMLGIALAFGTFAALTLATDEAVRANNPWVASFLLSAFAVPVLTAWGAAELARLVLRRGALIPGASGWGARLTRGLIAGAAGVALAVALVVWSELRVGRFQRGIPLSDWWITALSAALPAAVISLLGRRPRAGACARCGYDLAGLTKPGTRCPECGTHALHAA